MSNVERALSEHGIEIVGWLLPPSEESEPVVNADGRPEEQTPPPALLPNDLGASLQQLARRLGIPAEAYYLSLLCVAASLLPSQTRLEIDSQPRLTVPPILWGALLGESGSGKSHIINTLTGPLNDLQAEYYSLYRRQLESYKAAMREYKRMRRRGSAGVPPERPKLVDLYTNDWTTRDVDRALAQQPERGLLADLDPLAGFLWNIIDAQSSKKSERARWLGIYDGTDVRVSHDTLGQPFVYSPSVSVIGGIWPGAVRDAWQEDAHRNDSLWGRFAWVRVPLAPEPVIEGAPFQHPRQKLETVYRRMYSLPPKQHKLDREGLRIWSEWELKIRGDVLAETDGWIQSTLLLTRERAARIALVLHYLDAACSEVDPTELVPASTLTRAIEFSLWLHEQAKAIYAELRGSNESKPNLALRFVEKFKGCGPIDLKRCRNWWPARKKPSMNEIRDFLHAIVRSGHARWVDTRRIEVL